MQSETNYLDMRQAGQFIGQSYRWMQRHYVSLLMEGVTAYRIPKDSKKGRLMFDKDSLARYMDACKIRWNTLDR